MCNTLRGSTPFQGVIFYLWTDLDEICTVCVKLNSNSTLFVQFFFFWFRYGFRENLKFSIFSNFQMNRSRKLSMLEEKQRQFWNLHWIPHKVTQNDFQFSSYLFFTIFFSVFSKICFFGHLPAINKKLCLKIENRFV